MKPSDQFDKKVKQQLITAEVDDFKQSLVESSAKSTPLVHADDAAGPKDAGQVTVADLYKVLESTGQNIVTLSAFENKGDLKPCKAIILVTGILDTELVLKAVNAIHPKAEVV